MGIRSSGRLLLLPTVAICAVLAGGAARIVQDQCGPFTDVTPGFCPYVLELYYLGITAGTSATTFSPDDPLTRGQGAVFIAKGLNQSLARSSPRAPMQQWWTTTPHWDLGLGVTSLDEGIRQVASDGTDLWVLRSGTVYRVRASDGRLLGTWSGVAGGYGLVAALGRIWVAGTNGGAIGQGSDGALYMIDPSQPPGAATVVATGIGLNPIGLAFDGSRFWVTSPVVPGGSSVAIVTPTPSAPFDVVTVTEGFSLPMGVLFDGTSVWVADPALGDLLRLDANGAVIQNVHTTTNQFIAFDGANIWVPNPGGVTVVRALDGQIVATLSGNGVSGGNAAAFDGQRVLVTSPNADTLSFWNAAELRPLGFVSTGTATLPFFACSDGLNFWISLGGTGQLVRY